MNATDVKEKIKRANEEAAKRLNEADPYLIDTATAKEVIPDMKEIMLLHAAPYVDWENMCGPHKGSAVAAVLFEGWAKSPKEAVKLGAVVQSTPPHEVPAVILRHVASARRPGLSASVQRNA